MINPYYGATFFEWIGLFVSRMVSHAFFLQGDTRTLFSDDIQGIVFLLFSCNAAILGSFLLLKRLTMMANAISHTMVLGIAIVYFICKNISGIYLEHDHELPEMILFTISSFIALVTASATQYLARFRLIQEDAANAIVFSSLFALGITFISIFTKNAHAGVELLMGNPDALRLEDIQDILYALGMTIGVIFLLYRGFFIALFDPVFGKIGGFRPQAMIFLVLFLVSITLVSSFKAVGFIMSLAFFVIPPLISRQIARSLTSMILFSTAIGAGVSVASVALSRHILSVADVAVSTGALAVTTLFLFYILVLLGSLCFSARKSDEIRAMKQDL